MALALLWRSDYETGVPLLDAEHRGMFQLAQELFDSLDLPSLASDRRVVLALYRYTRLHFDHEEKLMRQSQYPGLDTHLMLHEKLISLLDEVAQPELDPELRRQGLTRLMLEWIAQHIMVADKAFAQFLASSASLESQ